MTNPDPANSTYRGPYVDPNITQTGPLFEDVTADPTGDFNSGAVLPSEAPARHVPGDVGDNAEANYEPVSDLGVSPVDHAPGAQGAADKPHHTSDEWPVEQQTISGVRAHTSAYGAAGAAYSQNIARGRDPYRNNGVIDQDSFLKNS